jgi:hypothetical protein
MVDAGSSLSRPRVARLRPNPSTRLHPGTLGLIALATYLAASTFLFGRGVVANLGGRVVGDDGADKTIFMWAFKWWPHAIAHGHDPLAANVVWFPDGIDLAWVTSVPLLSILFTPVTFTVGTIVAYNVAALLSPALSAWAAYFLARHLTRAFWPSLIAGWLFGFSAFEIGHMIGHLNLVFLPFIPIAALLALKYFDGSIGGRTFTVLLGLVLAGQFLTSTELFVDAVIIGAVFIGSAALFMTAARTRLSRLAVHAAMGVLFACVLVSPFLWHAFVVAGTGSAPVRSPFSESADILNYFVPTRLIWLQLPGSSHIAARFTATGAERGAYLGLPMLVIVLAYFWRRRSSAVVRSVAVAFFATIVASLGATIRLGGHSTIPAPWKLPAALPITRTILPIRLTLFVVLIAAMIVGLWLAENPRTLIRCGAVVLAIFFVLPTPSARIWSSRVPQPSFFDGGRHTDALANKTVLVMPFGGAGWSLFWQAEDDFQYRLIGGHLGREVTPAESSWRSIYLALGKGPSPISLESRFRRFLVEHRVDVVVVAPGTKPHSRRLIEGLGIQPTHTADSLVYRLRPAG